MQAAQNKVFPSKTTLNCGGKIIDLSTPVVMGIVNVTTDSFYDGGQASEIDEALRKTEKHLAAGATLIDVGAVSTRPRASEVSPSNELDRLLPTIEAIKNNFPEAIVSADTYRADVARQAVESGADIINDIGGGTLDKDMFKVVAKLQVPYIMMHIQGTPQTMQENPKYKNVTAEVLQYFVNGISELRALGVHDVIVDLGFGFGKTVEHNYELLKNINQFGVLNHPILAGLSRKSMINKVLGTSPKEALNGTTALNMVALNNGASILRVHDVKEAMECIQLYEQCK